MKKIAIFGGSGNTGLCAVDAALKKGLAVRALARDPSKFPEDVASKVEIVQGDVLNYDDVKKTVEGVDGAVIVLGTRNDVKPTTMMSEGTKNVLNALKEANIKPVSGCMSSFLFMELDKVTPMLRDLTKDHLRMLDALKASDRDWIAVCPPHIAGTEISWPAIRSLASSGHGMMGVLAASAMSVLWLGRKALKPFTTSESEPSGNYQIKHGSSPGRVISKYDLGFFLVDCLDKPEHYRQMVGIAKPPQA
ncbi:flavin reductase (NADPH) isoform X1 [Thrips palmi]|uniref:Flavin reductase (NADPH) isoform X1 n=1 Tax=Thrips palmi TaxID=161013 RepID=A0A6P8YHK4_THRPL|nr:flavin reductase (NADPH) isoform X1 [Thrips palmi]